MSNKKAMSTLLITIIIGLVVILLASMFIKLMVNTQKKVTNSQDDLSAIAGAAEDECKCLKGIFQDKTQVCAKTKPSDDYNEIALPAQCKSWKDCDETCFEKI